ncbi:MAG: carbamoyltransferase HypF [Candidatus Coatesbacteria bacterium]|nr:MAG: carbamoyltransferase HypF [Candidatus Coatesbacteria bacterium]
MKAEAATGRRRLRVEGVVQGVGFRPHVYNLASRLGLGGFVLNDGAGVVVEVEGPPARIEEFVTQLKAAPPPRAHLERVTAEELAAAGEAAFAIRESVGGEAETLVSPDLAICGDCLDELLAPADRRHRYAFLNCTNCGPRFTIIRGVPYDRPKTTMAAFAMCEACQGEYDDPANRRFHAQPNACPACGPRLALWDAAGEPVEAPDPVAAVQQYLFDGEIVAVKGLGGYHLACDASSAEAVEKLRARKYREDKPFAVMAWDVAVARLYAEIEEEELALLTSERRPIVLLRKHEPCHLPEAIAPRNRYLGLMLPYTPLHHLLFDDDLEILVMTSGNRADEPIAYRDDVAPRHLAGIADYFLTHDRLIARRVDDTVTRVFRGAEYPIRRSRGYVPLPIELGRSYERSVLAVGAELKNTFCLTKGSRAFVSHHIGDLENEATLEAFEEGVAHFREMFDVAPAAVARDLHPDYLASRYAQATGLPEVVVQHHHGHVASVLADAGYEEEGKVLGVAFDGAGLGEDGAIWGGEFLIVDRREYERAAHLKYVPLPGGDQAAREPWRMALSWLRELYGDDALRQPLPALAEIPARRRELVLEAAARGVNSPPTSSIGRLFDAVASLVGLRNAVNYEGQAAIELEQLASPDEEEAYEFAYEEGEPLVIDAAPVIAAVVADVVAGTAPEAIAGRFHNGLAAAIVAVASALREKSGPEVVALGGGVFQNVTLLEKTVPALETAGFRVLLHRQVPTNDGGLSLGQAAVALARLEGE